MLKKLILVVVFTISISYLMAQGGEQTGGDPTNPIPLDGGVSWLLAAGLAYVGKKVYDSRIKKNDILKKT
jgi:hypothetical protein